MQHTIKGLFKVNKTCTQFWLITGTFSTCINVLRMNIWSAVLALGWKPIWQGFIITAMTDAAGRTNRQTDRCLDMHEWKLNSVRGISKNSWIHQYKKEKINTQTKAWHILSRIVTKPTKWHVHPSKTQISLGIRPVRSESSLSARRKLGSLATH